MCWSAFYSRLFAANIYVVFVTHTHYNIDFSKLILQQNEYFFDKKHFQELWSAYICAKLLINKDKPQCALQSFLEH